MVQEGLAPGKHSGNLLSQSYARCLFLLKLCVLVRKSFHVCILYVVRTVSLSFFLIFSS